MTNKFIDPKIYYKTLPKKRMGAGMLLFNKKGELLIVKPHYKEHWSIPGGVVDENESPRQACIRETKEEINLDIKNPSFVCVDYTFAEKNSTKDENLQFLFYGGILNPKQQKNIRLDANELTEFKFISTKQTSKFFGLKLATRIKNVLQAIKNKTGLYLENGK